MFGVRRWQAGPTAEPEHPALVSPAPEIPMEPDVEIAVATLDPGTALLIEAVHLSLIDVHRRPLAFCFADRIAEELNVPQPPCPPPLAVSYRRG
jgi:hypothetical protein